MNTYSLKESHAFLHTHTHKPIWWARRLCDEVLSSFFLFLVLISFYYCYCYCSKSSRGSGSYLLLFICWAKALFPSAQSDFHMAFDMARVCFNSTCSSLCFAHEVWRIFTHMVMIMMMVSSMGLYACNAHHTVFSFLLSSALSSSPSSIWFVYVCMPVPRNDELWYDDFRFIHLQRNLCAKAIHFSRHVLCRVESSQVESSQVESFSFCTHFSNTPNSLGSPLPIQNARSLIR